MPLEYLAPPLFASVVQEGEVAATDLLNEFWNLPVPEEGFPEGSIGEQWSRFRAVGAPDTTLLPLPAPTPQGLVSVVFYAADFGEPVAGQQVSLRMKQHKPVFIGGIAETDRFKSVTTEIVEVDGVELARAVLEVYPSSTLEAEGYSGIYIAKWPQGPQGGVEVTVPDEGANWKELIESTEE